MFNFNFVCNDCANGEHDECKLRNQDKVTADCDCAHKERNG